MRHNRKPIFMGRDKDRLIEKYLPVYNENHRINKLERRFTINVKIQYALSVRNTYIMPITEPLSSVLSITNFGIMTTSAL